MRLLAKSRGRDWEARLLAKVVGASERDDYGCRFGGLPGDTVQVQTRKGRAPPAAAGRAAALLASPRQLIATIDLLAALRAPGERGDGVRAGACGVAAHTYYNVCRDAHRRRGPVAAPPPP